MLKRLSFIALLLGLLAGGTVAAVARLNRAPVTGEHRLPGLAAAVRVVRDERGMPYIHAESLADAMQAQGWVTAQDRLFQMAVARLYAQGRLAELAGGRALDLDIRHRVYGFARAAQRHWALLDSEHRALLQAYADGVNVVAGDRGQWPLELRLAGIDFEPWRPEDSLTIAYYMGWYSAANLNAELLAQLLIERLGPERWRELAPLNGNPDAPAVTPPPTATRPAIAAPRVGGRRSGASLLAYLGRGPASPPALGSNNWATAGERSAGGAPILAADPHLSGLILPGLFHPSGLIIGSGPAQRRAVGVTLPGIPGLLIGRNQDIANGITNAYGDAQDLFIETLPADRPGHYLDGARLRPLQRHEAQFRVRDADHPKGFRVHTEIIEETHRGPLLPGLHPGDDPAQRLSFRWAPYETMRPRLGIDYLLRARSAREAAAILEDATLLHVNMVFADRGGELVWQTTGRLPLRRRGDGAQPLPVTDGADDWRGFLPYGANPHRHGTDRGWLGNANHRTVDERYPHLYSTYFASRYRYERLAAVLDGGARFSAEDHWALQRDDYNVLAASVAPLMVQALSGSEFDDWAQLLASWDFHDRSDAVAPTLFQAMWRALPMLVLADELGEDLVAELARNWYFWAERMERMLHDDARWLDDLRTEQPEGRTEILRAAAARARDDLQARLGPGLARWRWGAVHRVRFVHPLRREGPGSGWLGAGEHAMGGSGETLYRARYGYDAPYAVKYSAVLRMVADLADDDKVMAVLPGGVSGRWGDPHFSDQVAPYLSGAPVYWWLSAQALAAHQRSTLWLRP